MAEFHLTTFNKIVSLYTQTQLSLKRRIIILNLGAVFCFVTLIVTETTLLHTNFAGKTEISIINPVMLGLVLVGILRYRHHLELRLHSLVMKTERLKANLSDQGLENIFIPALQPLKKLKFSASDTKNLHIHPLQPIRADLKSAKKNKKPSISQKS